MFKYNNKQLHELKHHVDYIREIEQYNVEPLTEQLLDQLVNRVYRYFQYNNSLPVHNRKTIDQLLFDKPYTGACGCLGPKDNELFCGCKMSNLLYEYRYDVAIYIDENHFNFDLESIKEAVEAESIRIPDNLTFEQFIQFLFSFK